MKRYKIFFNESEEDIHKKWAYDKILEFNNSKIVLDHSTYYYDDKFYSIKNLNKSF